MFTIDRCDDSVFKNVFSFARTPRIPLLLYYTGVTAYHLAALRLHTTLLYTSASLE